MSTQRHNRLLTAAALLLLAGPPAAAQETDVESEAAQEETAQQEAPRETAGDSGSGFTFRVDPLVIGALATDADTDSAKFQEYRDLGSGFLGALRLVGESAGGERTLGFSAVNAGRDDARYTLDYGVSGRYGVTFDYNKIPHRFGNGGRMLWTRTADGALEIADPVQAQLQGAVQQQFNANRNGLTFAFLDNLLAPYLATAQGIDLGLQRDRTLARIGLGSLGGLAWGLEYTHENRKGNRAYGGSFGFNNVTEVPEPIDYDTTDAELAAEWNGSRGGLRFGYRYSVFENNIGTLVWDNPFRITDATDPNAYLSPSSSSVNGSVRGFADLAPDNRASLLFADGSARLGGGWWINGRLAYNVMTQDDPLLPYTLNTAIVGIDEAGAAFNPTDVANLPVRRADTEVDTLNLAAQAGTRFGEDVALTFRYRYYDYDNQSPRIELPGYVRFHSVWEEIPRITVPYAYTRQDLGAELNWDVFQRSRLGLGYRHEIWDREFREVESSDEDIFILSFDTRPVDRLNVRASYEFGDRSIDGYNPAAQGFSFLEPGEGIDNQPTLRKFAQAAREYNQLNVTADFFPAPAWSFTAGVTGRDEDYDESEIGLIADETLQYNAELAYTPGENLNIYVFGHRSDRESFQRARQSGGTPSTRPLDNWELTLDEVTDTWGAGVTAHPRKRWTVDVSGRWSRSDGFADFFAFAGGLPLSGTPPRTEATDFDNYEDVELLALLSRLGFRLNERTEIGLSYRYEDYTIDSFILQGLRNYLPGALLLNAENGDYKANILGLELRLAF